MERGEVDGLMGEREESGFPVRQKRGDFSRGWVHINSTDPRVPPIVFANYFDEPNDLKVARLAVDRLLRVAGELVRVGGLHNGREGNNCAPALNCRRSCTASWGAMACLPFAMLPCPPSAPGVGGFGLSSSSKKNGWAQWVRDTVSSYHFFGTAALGEPARRGA